MKSNGLEAAFKKVVSKDGNRPILQCVHFDTDGSMTATDSHVLLRVDHAHELKGELNLDLYSFLPADPSDKYPNTKQLIPQKSDLSYELYADTADLKKALPVIKAMAKSTMVTLTLSTNGTRLTAFNDSSEATITVQTRFPDNPVDSGARRVRGGDELMLVACNPVYLANAFEYFVKIGQGQIMIGFVEPLRPIILKNDVSTYLITPIRTY